jgi:hypothetical protein
VAPVRAARGRVPLRARISPAAAGTGDRRAERIRRHQGGWLAGDAAPIIQALADVATIGLLQERAIRRGEVLTEQLQGALNSRIVIEQAKGVVAQARSVSVDEAFTLIREFARVADRDCLRSSPRSTPGLPTPAVSSRSRR